MRILIALLALTGAQSASAELKKETNSEIGKWTIYSENDPMTDKKDCVAYYNDDRRLQLTLTSFAVSYRGRGGLRSYRLRFDESPALPLELPTDVESRISAFVLDGPRFEQVLNAKRVRIQAGTVLSSIVNDDVDMSDGRKVLDHMQTLGCSR